MTFDVPRHNVSPKKGEENGAQKKRGRQPRPHKLSNMISLSFAISPEKVKYWYFLVNSHKRSKLEVYMQVLHTSNRKHFNILISLRPVWQIPRMDSFAKYAYSCRICLLEFFIVFRLKNYKKIPERQIRQIYPYVANESTPSYLPK